jgi:hypothetical protein
MLLLFHLLSYRCTEMDVTQLEAIGKLRAAIGYLGEREQYAWWQSSFFSPGSRAFLAPVFARTQLLAQCTGVMGAAARVHDERIGVGRVFHLFRLHEDMEQGIHHALHDETLGAKIMQLVVNREAALAYLRLQARAVRGGNKAGVGPVRIGGTHDLSDPDYWQIAAAHYLRGFEQGAQVFPYFADIAR